jgi:hypothetical protein
MTEWQKKLEEELRPGLIARAQNGREAQVGLHYNSKDGTLRLAWKDEDDQQWHLTIPHATLMTLTNAMVKRLYPTAHPRRRSKDGPRREKRG